MYRCDPNVDPPRSLAGVPAKSLLFFRVGQCFQLEFPRMFQGSLDIRVKMQIMC